MRPPIAEMPGPHTYQPGPHDAGVRRYFGLGQFALLSNATYQQLRKWRHSAVTWVPSPDVVVGDHPGWSLACIRSWSQGGPPFARPRTVMFADQAAMRARYHGMPTNTLWACIGDGTIPRPVVWIDDRPGWLS
ncbi:hypothetical protein [Nocardia sp. CA-119907]|uniref:hypothetical protein n=1 Tax=Nocardia sp. CA-119907 TaxID=3239973 RepID=UPI003D96AA90